MIQTTYHHPTRRETFAAQADLRRPPCVTRMVPHRPLHGNDAVASLPTVQPAPPTQRRRQVS
jgi:hypothetical protein